MFLVFKIYCNVERFITHVATYFKCIIVDFTNVVLVVKVCGKKKNCMAFMPLCQIDALIYLLKLKVHNIRN